MKPGQIVEVFEDPITKQKPEGKFKLIEHFPMAGEKQEHLQQWYGMFLPDGMKTMRIISTK